MARVAVVVVNHNAGPLLARAVAALARQTLAPARVLVVDNASEDGSADGLEGVEVVRLEENVGFAAANNLAVRAAADCEWVALLNPDAFPEPEWLERLVAAARRRPDCALFGSRLLMAEDPSRLDGAGDAYHVSGLAWRVDHGCDAAGRAGAEAEVFSPCAAAALYRRDAFVSAGGFDESFFCYYEDVDLAFRLRLAGHRCLYVPDAVVHHVGSAITGAVSDFAVYHSYRNLVRTWVKDMPGPLVPLYLPQLLLVNVLLLGAFGVRGRAGVVLRAQRDALRGLPAAIRARRAVQATRVVGARELRRAMVTGLAAYLTNFTRYRQRLLRAPAGEAA